MISYTNYTDNTKEEFEDLVMPETIDSINICCDNGRFYLSLNGKSVFKNLSMGIDFEFDFNRK